MKRTSGTNYITLRYWYYEIYLNQMWYRDQAPAYDRVRSCQIHSPWKSKMAAVDIISFKKYQYLWIYGDICTRFGRKMHCDHLQMIPWPTRNTLCRTWSLSNATFSFLIMWRSSSSKSAAVYKISWKSDDFSLRYGDISIFNMAVVRHLEIVLPPYETTHEVSVAGRSCLSNFMAGKST